ncbi:MAG: AtzH-like domain-containing protein, partial [Sphingobium sp.]
RDPMMLIDESDALATLTAASDAYERALHHNDLAALDTLFWEDVRTIRFGARENLHGIEEIRAFRMARPGGAPARENLRRDVTLFGPDHGHCAIEFRYRDSGVVGRQTQMWARIDGAWRVVAAHVSLLAA